MPRVVNFNAGPSTLPLAALEEAQAELLDFKGAGMSVMELSHRSPEYDAVHNEAISLVRELMGVSDDYEVLLVQGGASTQFALVPMNLRPTGSADYILTGTWSQKALKEAEILGKARVAASTEAESFTRIPRAGPFGFPSRRAEGRGTAIGNEHSGDAPARRRSTYSHGAARMASSDGARRGRARRPARAGHW